LAESLKDKIVFITGASAGIGKSCAEQFAAEGAKLILAARRIERLHELAENLKDKYGTDSVSYQLDVCDRNAVKNVIENFLQDWKAVDILLNNAGLSQGLDKIQDGDIDDWERMIDTNVKGLLYITKYILPGMIKRESGHVINISSIAGLGVYPLGNVYCASKYAVRALTEGMIIDTVDTPIKVSAVSPGLVDTEFSTVRFKGDKSRADKVYEGIDALTADDIAETVLFCATRPRHANITEVVILATNQASGAIVHRKT
jgi:3-hydroxy acid dehydrogenase/malonic semialdehyde reductase